MNPLAMRLFPPSLRADFEMGDTYAYRRLPPLVCPIFAYAGAEDVDTPASDVQAWTHESNEDAVMRPYPGEHFFLRDGEATVLRDLTPVLKLDLVQNHLIEIERDAPATQHFPAIPHTQ
jgi:medium-chain acyl-[acyl-carrier-protein] hydrolase